MRDRMMMFEKREELREGSGRKWAWMKGVFVLCASMLVSNIRSAGFALEVSRCWMDRLSSSPFCPFLCLCLYLILNILILFLALRSRNSSASTHHYQCQCQCQCSQFYHKPEAIYACHTSPSFETLTTLHAESKGEEETQSLTVNGEELVESLAEDKVDAAETQKAPAMVLQRSCSVRELHCKKVNKPSNLSRESNRIQPPVEVIFEICSMEEECDQEREGNLNWSCEELNAKAESFIGNFYRELKMQREESWKRLCAIYRKSC